MSRRDDVMLAAAIAGRPGLAQINLLETSADGALESIETRTLKDLDHQIAAGLQALARER